MTDNNGENLPVNRQPPEFFASARGFGARLRALRGAAHLSQTELGTAVGVALSAVNAWENEKRPPEGGLVFIRLAEELGCSVDYLLTGKQTLGLEYVITGLEQLLDEARRIQLGGEPDAQMPGFAEPEEVLPGKASRRAKGA